MVTEVITDQRLGLVIVFVLPNTLHSIASESHHTCVWEAGWAFILSILFPRWRNPGGGRLLDSARVSCREAEHIRGLGPQPLAR